MNIDQAAAVKVELTTTEWLQAMNVGCMRAAKARAGGLTQRWGGRPEWSDANHIMGATGEAVVAKHFGVFWLGTGEVGGPDVGGIQVRANRRPSDSLMLHESDANGAVFVAVTVVEGRGWLRGWIHGRDGKRREWWRDPTGQGRPAFFVPDDALFPMAGLCVVGGQIVTVEGGV